MQKFDVIIIGGGAAGLFCAATAGKRGQTVLVLEKNSQVGRKILISGGGRCNFTNLDVKAENFVSRNPHFCKSALARFTPEDFIRLIKKHRIEFYEKKLGQLFCRDGARLIVEMLLRECAEANVRILTGCDVKTIERDEYFLIKTGAADFRAASLVLATGGLSFPKVGATDFGYRIARQFGIEIVETRPSLVPLVFSGESERRDFQKLAGISIDANAVAGKASFRENILFTHRGLSGPAVLQISNYWKKNQSLNFDLLPETDLLQEITTNRSSRQTLVNFLGKFLPQRFAEIYVARNFLNKPLDQLSNREIEAVAGKLNDWKVLFNETEGYGKAEVTLGGISAAELSSQTMETKKVDGLFFIGELNDVTGWLGGYNFQWAWASAFAAGNAL